MTNQADRAADAGESAGGKDGLLDRWVRDHPVWTFWFAAGVATAMFLAVYAVVGAPLIKVGFPLNDAVTSYVGALATTVVALAGALVSVMLARLALKLGYKAKAAADQANEIQEQMRKFADPRLAETRDGHKAAASLDLLGTLLRVYSAATFSSDSASPPPVEAIRNTYRRANDLISEPGLYRYCAQLLGTATTADRFAVVQSLIYESTMALGRDGKAGQEDKDGTARNAERVAVEIATLSRLIAHAKRAALSCTTHKLHQMALDLDWEGAAGDMSGCEATARSDLLNDRGGGGVGTVVFKREGEGAKVEAADEAPVLIGSLFDKGKKTVIHVLETDLHDLVDGIKHVAAVAMMQTRIHECLRDYAAACAEGANVGCVDVVIARWDSSLKDDPRTVADALREHPEDRAGEPVVELGMQSVWDKAVFIAKNPEVGRAIEAAMKDLVFLRKLRQMNVSGALYEYQGVDLEDEGNQELIAEEQRSARLSGKRLWYIHTAISELRNMYARKGYVTVPDFDPYEQLTHGDNAIVLIRPYFARIDMSLRNSEWGVQNQWFEDCLAGYLNYRWDGAHH